MTKLLEDLIENLDHELIRFGYAESSLKLYRTRWRELLAYAKKREELHYTEQLGIDFIKDCHHVEQDDFKRKLTRAETRELRIIRLLGDYQLHNTVRRTVRRPVVAVEPVFAATSNAFKAHCRLRGYGKSSITVYVRYATRFMDYLSSQGIVDFSNLSMGEIHNFLRTLLGFSYKTVDLNLCALRAFLRFLNQRGDVSDNFAEKLPKVKGHKQTCIPSTWTHDELKKLTDAIDRGNPTGKRDYAIIILACRLGLRSSDIKALRFDNIDWSSKKLRLVQTKTRQPLELPIPRDVGWAIIDYLKGGRPVVDDDHIFITSKAPYKPLSEEDHLEGRIRKYMQVAGLCETRKSPCGMHSLRHTLASVLLEKDTPLPIISDIIGHISMNSTAVYLKVDMKKLAECPLEIEEVFHA